MKLRIPGHKFNQSDQRILFVNALALIVACMNNLQPFIPYKPNESNSRYWGFDSGNDWRVTFVEKSPTDIVITYRYQCPSVRKEELLAEKLIEKYKAEIIND